MLRLYGHQWYKRDTMANKSAVIHLRSTPDFKSRLVDESAKMNVDVSALVTMVMTEHLDKKDRERGTVAAK